MMKSEQSVAQHYTHGSLEQAILAALAASGKDLEHLTPADLAPVDEFHIGGREATVDFAAQLEIKPGLEMLDIGSGLGGASRYFAHECGCRVTGIDLTQEFVSTAERLAKRVRLENCVSYRQASALALPFTAARFDVAYMLHVGMNIEDKAGLFAEVRRTLKPGGIFGIYDVMCDSGEGDLRFPVPWATHSDMSFVETPATYWRLLEGAGFVVLAERSRRAFAVEFFDKMRARAAQDAATPPLGLHILMGASAPQKVANMIENLERGLIVPVEIIARAV
ncbi:class I SAM-dependent methyltransferase [Methylovirgula sp. HY1]|uniref:class I SAM-dependent methyltransferase n=1 Tax=Methylovirgula sp. HY1 TaxID=2822761 RepID=UPI001C77BADD|nr:class I SAM-dependent methyltransferase [Methylovirgula sp. HY1]QXX76380.1 Erythromycin 3''-O-methyltransferase [Methylovirgula sp. HY1]